MPIKEIPNNTRFGKLIVISKTDKPKDKKRTAIYYLCKCDCGKEHITSSVQLRDGSTQSCGCLRKEMAFKKTFKDISGKKFGKLTALKVVGSDDGTVWLCKCDCGNEHIVKKSALSSGSVQSCGCESEKLIDLTGQKFGKILVLNKGQRKSKQTTWDCLCDCGNKVNVFSSNLKRGLTESCGCTKSKGEEKILEILKQNNINFISQYTFDNLTGLGMGKLKFDFAIFNDTKLSHLIEYDGIQHYDKSNFLYTEQLALHDQLKNEFCENNNIRLIRLRDYKNLTIEDLL